MKKFLALGLLLGAALMVATPVLAADDEKKWNFTGMVRVRADYFENYDFVQPTPDGTDDNGGFWPYTIRLGLEGQITDTVRGLVELRNDSTFGGSPTYNEYAFLPPAPFPGPVTGPYSYSNNSQGSNDVIIYQGFIEVKDLGIGGFDMKVGRQEHTYGTELLLGDNDFYTGQSYDGLRLTWGRERYALNGFYYKLVENNFSSTPAGDSSDTNLWGVTFDWMMEKWGDLGFFYLTHQGLDQASGITATNLPGSLASYGARWGRLAVEDDQWFDWNLEYVMQSGEITSTLDHDADAVEAWLGFNLGGDGTRHRFALGYLNASGDDGTTGADFEGFFPLFNDSHQWNRLGNIDNFVVSNIEDINLSYTLNASKHMLMLAVHDLALDEPTTVGTTTEDDLGMTWDVVYEHRTTDNYGFQLGLSSLMAGDLQELAVAPLSVEDPFRVWGQFTLTW